MLGKEGLAGMTGKVAGLGLVAKLGLGATLAAAGIASAGVAGMLPAAATNAVRDAIHVGSPADTDKPDNFGARVSADATGESDGQHGVEGSQISEEAPGAAHRADSAAPDEPPGQTGETGLTRANQTPAAPHAPDAPASAGHPSGQPDAAGQAREDHAPASVPSTVPAQGHTTGDATPGE